MFNQEQELLDKSLKLMMTVNTYNRIKAIAVRDNVSMGDVVRDCITGSIDDREKWQPPKFAEQG